MEPFKQAILIVCRNEATLLHADKAFTLLLRTLQENESELASVLRERLVEEIKKRITVVSTVLQVMENRNYDFGLESSRGARDSSTVLAETLADWTAPVRVDLARYAKNSTETRCSVFGSS